MKCMAALTNFENFSERYLPQREIFVKLASYYKNATLQKPDSVAVNLM